MLWNRHITIEGDLTETIHYFINELRSFIGAFALKEDRVLEELRISLNFYKSPVLRKHLSAHEIAEFFKCRIIELIKTPIAYDRANMLSKAEVIKNLLESILSYPEIDVDKLYTIVSAELRS